MRELYLDNAQQLQVHLEGVNEVLECSLCLTGLNSPDILTTMKIKVTVESSWVGPREHFFDDWGNAEEFARAMRDCQYRTKVEEVLAND